MFSSQTERRAQICLLLIAHIILFIHLSFILRHMLCRYTPCICDIGQGLLILHYTSMLTCPRVRPPEVMVRPGVCKVQKGSDQGEHGRQLLVIVINDSSICFPSLSSTLHQIRQIRVPLANTQAPSKFMNPRLCVYLCLHDVLLACWWLACTSSNCVKDKIFTTNLL